MVEMSVDMMLQVGGAVGVVVMSLLSALLTMHLKNSRREAQRQEEINHEFKQSMTIIIDRLEKVEDTAASNLSKHSFNDYRLKQLEGQDKGAALADAIVAKLKEAI